MFCLPYVAHQHGGGRRGGERVEHAEQQREDGKETGEARTNQERPIFRGRRAGRKTDAPK